MQTSKNNIYFINKKSKSTPLNPKAKYIRTLKVKVFTQTKLRARKAHLFISMSAIFFSLKTRKNIKTKPPISVEAINVNKYNELQVVVAKNSFNKREVTCTILINKWLSSLNIYQPFILNNTSNGIIFLINPLFNVIEVINTKNIHKVTLNLLPKDSKNKSVTYPIFNNLRSSKNYWPHLKFAKFKNNILNNFYKDNQKLTKINKSHKISKKIVSLLKSTQISNKTKNNSIRSKLKKINLKYSTRKTIKKISKKWFSHESAKLNRFGRKYYSQNLRRKLPVFGVWKMRKLPISKHIYNKFKKQFIEASLSVVTSIKRQNRLKILMSQFPTNTRRRLKIKWNIKKSYDYKPFHKIISQNQKSKCTKIIKILTSKQVILGLFKFNILYKKKLNKLLLADLKLFNSKRTYMQKLSSSLLFTNSWKITHKKTKLKINLINKTLIKTKKNKKMTKFNKANKLSLFALNKISKQMAYKIKWSNYFELKSFRWKFYNKRWYFTMSRWKRLVEFRRMLRNAWRNYRKLQKNFLFIKLLRANFKYILGLKESELLKTWTKIRRNTNSDMNISPVDYLNQALQLKMDGLTMFLGLAPNRVMSQELIHFGALRINGLVVTNINHSVSQNDMVQIDSKVNQEIQQLYQSTHWNSVRARLKFTKFLQVQWSIMLFMLVRWPYKHELFSESILNQRWVRFFIRYFPVRIAKYQKAKIKWYKY